MTTDYLKNFSLRNKKAIVVGGSGLLGSEIVKALLSASAQVINLDKKSLSLSPCYKNESKKYQYSLFDIKMSNALDKNVDKILKKFGCPDIFINCSYPTTKNWSKSSFKNNKISNLRDNVDLHLNSYAWFAYKICDIMKKSKKKAQL